MPFCASCGTQLPDGSKFCASCGTPTPQVRVSRFDILTFFFFQRLKHRQHLKQRKLKHRTQRRNRSLVFLILPTNRLSAFRNAMRARKSLARRAWSQPIANIIRRCACACTLVRFVLYALHLFIRQCRHISVPSLFRLRMSTTRRIPQCF